MVDYGNITNQHKGKKMTIEELNAVDPAYKKLVCLNQRQVATILGVSSSSLESWRKLCIGPTHIKVKNGKRSRVLYAKSSIVDWVNDSIKTV